MTPTIEELRKWSAEKLMGWIILKIPAGQYYNEVVSGNSEPIFKCWVLHWQPDSQDAPAWQIQAVIEAMAEKGFEVRIYFPNTFIPSDMRYEVEFADAKEVISGSMGEAILRAAYAAVEGSDG